MLKATVGGLVGLAVALAIVLMFGQPPAWVGAGAKAHPIMAAVFLLWMATMACLLGFKSRR